MRCKINEKSENEIILEVHGTLMGIESTEHFEGELEKLSKTDKKIITLNFSNVDSINSSCIGKIFMFQKKLEEQERKIQIRGCSDSLLKTFHLIKLESLISIEQ